jgi:hypothetical protein
MGFLWRFDDFVALVSPSVAFVNKGFQEGTSIHRRCMKGEWRAETLRRRQESLVAGLGADGRPAYENMSPRIREAFERTRERTRERARARMLEPLPAEDDEPPGPWPAGARFMAEVDPELYADYVGVVPPQTLAYYDAAAMARFLDPILRVMATKDAPEHAATFETIRGHAQWWVEHDRLSPPKDKAR